LPVSSAEGITFDPSDDDWKRIEKAYPDILEADHETITHIANEYLLRAQFEGNAPFLVDAMAWLETTEKSAKTFWGSTCGEGGSCKDDATFYAQNYVARQIDHPAFKGSDAAKWCELVTILTSVVSAFGIARRDMPKEAAVGFVEFVEGESWVAMIFRLTEWAKSKGLPTSASKGANKSKSGTPSPFVVFIRELQNTFPVELRRHSHSENAIAQAISVARQKDKAAKGAG
jgi:hypothetical protein